MEEGRLDSEALKPGVAVADWHLAVILAADVDAADKLFAIASRMLAAVHALAVV